MKPLIPLKFMLPVGLFIIALSFILTNFLNIPDWANGFLKGLGIGIIVISLIKGWYVKRTQE